MSNKHITSISILIFYFSFRILWSKNGMQMYNDNCVDMFILRLCFLWSMICILWQEDNNHIEWHKYFRRMLRYEIFHCYLMSSMFDVWRSLQNKKHQTINISKVSDIYEKWQKMYKFWYKYTSQIHRLNNKIIVSNLIQLLHFHMYILLQTTIIWTLSIYVIHFVQYVSQPF